MKTTRGLRPVFWTGSVLAVGIAALTAAAITRAQAVEDGGGSLLHGVNFMMKTVLDESICVETDVAVNATPRVFVAPCTGASSQRWTYTDGADGSSVVVSELGHCLEVDRESQSMTLQLVTCDYRTNQRFTLTNVGKIVRKFSNYCLTVHSPIVSGNPVFVEECQSSSVRGQEWRLVQ